MSTQKRRSLKVLGVVLTSTLAAAISIIPAQVAHAADINLERIAPRADDVVSLGAVTFEGRVGDQTATSAKTHVTFAVDLSGSTSSPRGMDCNGDGAVDALDDLNTDNSVGDVLDCQIAAIVTMNSRLAAIRDSDRDIRVSIVGYGSNAVAAYMDPENNSFKVAPTWTGRGNSGIEGDVLPRVDEVANSLRRGQIGRFVTQNVGTGTDFNLAAHRAVDTTLNQMEGDNGYVFFFSDGQASASSYTLDLIGRNKDRVKFRTFAVGTGAGGCQGTQLARMAEASDEECTYVQDVADLADDLIASKPSNIENLTVTVGDQEAAAEIDPIGNWRASLDVLTLGRHEATIRVVKKDGTPDYIETWDFEVDLAKKTYVALGDSFASGEGVRPYLDQEKAVDHHDSDGSQGEITTDYACHRASDGWVSRVAEGGGNLMDLDFRACSGARIVDLTSNRQHRKIVLSPENGKLSVDSRSLYNSPQLEGLKSNLSGLVTLSIGGNDAAFGPVIERCLRKSNCEEQTLPGTDFGLGEWAKAKLALLSLNYAALYSEVRNRAPNADIVVTTYPKLIDASGYKRLTLKIDEDEAEFLNDNAEILGEIIKHRAGRVGFRVADVRDKFEGHGAGSSDPWIEGVVFNKMGAWGNAFANSSSFHPNQSGSDAYAEVVEGSINSTPMNGQLFRSVAASDVDPEVNWIVNDPEGYLAAQPPELVAAASNTVFQVFDVHLPYSTCDGAPTDADTLFVSEGFAPGTEVEVLFEDEEGVTHSFTQAADAEGILTVSVVASADTDVTTVSATGPSAEGGLAIATANVPTASAQVCPPPAAQGSVGTVDGSTSSLGVGMGSLFGSADGSGG